MKALPETIIPGQPITALAPMQDVTTLPFMRVIGQCGAPDFFFTEYFRVHSTSTLETHILSSITDHSTGRPVFAQLIGESLPDLERTVALLKPYPTAGIDLNMGCPAPKVYKKNVGGGLMRDPDKVEGIFECLRNAVEGRFTVKMRIGFDSTEHYERILDLVNQYEIDLLSVHGRTVKEGYRSEVHYDFIKVAADQCHCPVLANGNILSAEKAADVLNYTGCAGVMIGRHAIRNPWIFRQIREYLSGVAMFVPELQDVRIYVDWIFDATNEPDLSESRHLGRMKKLLNFVGLGVDPEGEFLRTMRRAKTRQELLSICDTYMVDDSQASQPFALEPYDGLVARPNCEVPHQPGTLRAALLG